MAIPRRIRVAQRTSGLAVAACCLLCSVGLSFRVLRRLRIDAKQYPLSDAPSQNGQFIKTNKQGRQVMKYVTSLWLEDLNDLDLSQFKTRHNVSLADASAGKDPILEILEDAGVTDVDPRIIDLLPTWHEVSSLYGDISEPVVYGLDSCVSFRRDVVPTEAYLGVAGFFNTGTNALTYYLRANLVMPSNTHADRHAGILTQVPWQKHTEFNMHDNVTNVLHGDVPKHRVFPIVIIRDPFTWAQSMCQQPYDVKWQRNGLPCPKFVSDSKAVPVTMNTHGQQSWPSLLHLWNDWYRQYFDAAEPRLMVRFEDLLWRPKAVLSIIKSCTGAAWKDPQRFYYVVDRSKWEHTKQYGPQSNMITAMIKHGRASARLLGLSSADLAFAHEQLDSKLMSFFHYHTPA